MTRLTRPHGHEDISANPAGAVRGKRTLSAIRPIVRRGLSRNEAAIYIGVGVTKFDALVASGTMPKPKRIDGRRVWDIVALDFAFDRLPDENGMPDQTWDDVDGA
jgi:hypothetical protein